MDFRRSYYGPWRELEDGEFTLDESGIGNAIRQALKREPTRKDFELAGTMVRLFSTLPASHGRTSVVKTLRGDAKVNKKLPEYGAYEGLKEYTGKGMDALAEYVETSMRAAGLRKEQSEDDYDSDQPEYIERVKQSPDEGIMLGAAIARMGAKYAEAALAPKVKKEKIMSATKFWDDRLTKETVDSLRDELEKLRAAGLLYTHGSYNEWGLKCAMRLKDSYSTGGASVKGDEVHYTYFNRELFAFENRGVKLSWEDVGAEVVTNMRITVVADKAGVTKRWKLDFVPAKTDGHNYERLKANGFQRV